MKSIKSHGFADAKAYFAIANTPLFLLHKLKTDPQVRRFASATSDRELLRNLKSAIRRKPKDLNEAVQPYVLLVALSMKENISSLAQASTLKADLYDWYSVIAEALVQTYNPTSVATVVVPNEVRQPQLHTKPQASVTHNRIYVSE